MTDLNERISIQRFIETLVDETTDDGSITLSRFSDLEDAELALLKESWLKISSRRRSRLLKNMKELAEEDTLVCFDQVALMALDDPEDSVRENAINLLWEYEHKCLIPILIRMMESDKARNVRAAASTALGKFIYLGEIEEIPTESYLQTENALLNVIHGKDDPNLRQRALESLSFSCHKEAQDEIRKAFASEDPNWVASALFSMGRSADTRWTDMVLESLDHPVLDVQYAAVRAAGELELSDAREPLLLLLDNTNQLNEELHNTIIWSLSQIGGESVRSALEFMLEMAEEDEDDEEIEVLEEALENLEFNEGMQFFEMFDFDLPDDDEDAYDDLGDSNGHEPEEEN
jgi:HEAT repeat protein